MSKKVFKDRWSDAQELRKSFPGRFEAPSLQEINKLEEGTIVKICNGDERFWVNITEKRPTGSGFERKFVGRVDNHLIGKQKYNFGDAVLFSGKHVYSIYREEDFKEDKKFLVDRENKRK